MLGTHHRSGIKARSALFVIRYPLFVTRANNVVTPPKVGGARGGMKRDLIRSTIFNLLNTIKMYMLN